MSELLDLLEQQHQERLEQLERGEASPTFLDGVRMLIVDLRQAGEELADPAERAQLRALLRFWGGVLYDHSGVYPSTALLPARAPLPLPTEEAPRRPTPRLIWLLIGAASVMILLVGGILVGWASLAHANQAGESLPTPATAPLVLQSAVGTGLGESGVVTETAKIFCLGTPEVVATFVLKGLQPDVQLRWELWRNGQMTAAEPAAPWGQEWQYVTIRLQSDSPEGLEPGEYELHLYAGDQAVARQSFEVLDADPQISGLQVADVPVGYASGERNFASGLRVVYLSYDYAGLCTASRVTHVLARAGQALHETVEQWTYPAQGHRQVAFQAQDGIEFTPGDYELVVKINNRERGRVGFTVEGSAAEVAEKEPWVPPVFGDVTVALAAYPNGTPILPVRDVAFDVTTKVVYAIFDYQGMDDGMLWSAVWTLNGQEIARHEEIWHVDQGGTEGTTWATYYDPSGQPIAPGEYSVTLFLNSVAQHSATFTVGGVGTP